MIAVENFGVNTRNDGRKVLLEKVNMIVTNTSVQRKTSKKTTWKNPNDETKYEIDFILEELS